MSERKAKDNPLKRECDSESQRTRGERLEKRCKDYCCRLRSAQVHKNVGSVRQTARSLGCCGLE